GAPVPGSIHTSNRDLQPSTPCIRRRTRHLPMEGLRPWRQTAEDDIARNGVPAPVLPPYPTPRIRSDPPLRIPGQPLSHRPASPLPRVAGNAAETARPRCPRFLHLALSPLWRGYGCRSE